jgi:hypothetical protein
MSREGAPFFGQATPPTNYIAVDCVQPVHAEVVHHCATVLPLRRAFWAADVPRK